MSLRIKTPKYRWSLFAYTFASSEPILKFSAVLKRYDFFVMIFQLLQFVADQIGFVTDGEVNQIHRYYSTDLIRFSLFAWNFASSLFSERCSPQNPWFWPNPSKKAGFACALEWLPFLRYLELCVKILRCGRSAPETHESGEFSARATPHGGTSHPLSQTRRVDRASWVPPWSRPFWCRCSQGSKSFEKIWTVYQILLMH